MRLNVEKYGSAEVTRWIDIGAEKSWNRKSGSESVDIVWTRGENG